MIDNVIIVVDIIVVLAAAAFVVDVAVCRPHCRYYYECGNYYYYYYYYSLIRSFQFCKLLRFDQDSPATENVHEIRMSTTIMKMHYTAVYCFKTV